MSGESQCTLSVTRDMNPEIPKQMNQKCCRLDRDTRWRNVDKGLNSLLLLSPSYFRHWNSVRQRHQDGSQEFQPLSLSLIKLALWKQQPSYYISRLLLQKWYRRTSRRFYVVSRDAVYKLTQVRVNWNALPWQILAMYLCIPLNGIWWHHCYGD